MFSSHSILSAPRVRPWLLGHMGRIGFYGLYSAVSLATTGGFVWSYFRIDVGEALYEPIPGARVAAISLMPLVIFLVIGRITTRKGDSDAPLPPTGVYRISRHPGSFALLLWAVLHLGNVTEDRNVIAFATMAAISGAAIVKNEWIRRQVANQGRPSYMDETSIIPFLAILSGHQTLSPRQIGWARPVAALAIYGSILWLHPYVFGVDPLAPFR